MIGEEQIKILQDLARKYLNNTREFFTKEGVWRDYNDDDFWKDIIYQVAVVGNSSVYEPLKKSTKAQRDLNFLSLGQLSIDERQKIINQIFREFGVRYASADIAKDKKTRALMKNFAFLKAFKGGPAEYFHSLMSLPDDDSRVNRVIKDMSYIKLKGARDLLAGLDIVTNIIALDVRIINIFRGIGIPMPDDIQTNCRAYNDLQNEIIQRVCRPLGITGVMLDRILYRNYDKILNDISLSM